MLRDNIRPESDLANVDRTLKRQCIAGRTFVRCLMKHLGYTPYQGLFHIESQQNAIDVEIRRWKNICSMSELNKQHDSNIEDVETTSFQHIIAAWV